MAEFLRSELTEADTEEEDTTVASGYSAWMASNRLSRVSLGTYRLLTTTWVPVLPEVVTEDSLPSSTPLARFSTSAVSACWPRS